MRLWRRSVVKFLLREIEEKHGGRVKPYSERGLEELERGLLQYAQKIEQDLWLRKALRVGRDELVADMKAIRREGKRG
jgi:hypothetical protein